MKTGSFTQKARRKLLLLLTVFFMCAGQAYAQFPAPYCAVTFPNNTEAITNVNFAGINNTTSATSTTPLEDYLSITGTVAQGLTYPFSAQGNTVGNFSTYFRVFIDWNQNNDFTDAGESYDIGIVTNSTGTDGIQTNNNITVPAGALLGNTRMRVIKKFNGYTTPCNNTGFGQAEDYTINVIVPPCTPPSATFTVVPNCGANQYSVNVNITSMGTATSVGITQGSTTYATATTTGTYTVGPFASGTSNTFTLTHDVNPICSLVSAPQAYTCPPSNDECSSAKLLIVTPGTVCSTIDSGTTVGASASANALGGTCGTTNSFGDDVWFQFVAVGTSVIIDETNVIGGTTDLITTVYSGTCGALTFMACSDPQNFQVNGLTIGQTYYIRVATYSGSATVTAKFNICLTTPVPPVNDLCATATALIPSTTNICGGATAGTTQYATTETQTTPTCNATGVNDDVWYTFTALNSTHIIQLSGASNTTAAQVYSGVCGALATVVCGSTTSGAASITATGLTVGQPYYVRVYSTSTTATTFSTFNICVISTPSNDECINAATITPQASTNCTSGISGSTAGATQSAGASSCGNTGTNDDVWYQFTATASTHRFILSNVSGSTDMAMGLYEGVCGSLTQLVCSDPNTFDASNLTPGNTYYVRVWTYTSTATTTASFDLCIGTISCPYPTSPTATNFTTSSADLGWTIPTAPMEYEVEYGLGQFTQGTGTKISVPSNPYTLGGLMSGTEYSYFVRAICLPGDTSQWSARATFATLCDPSYSSGYAQTFTGSDIPAPCWVEARGFLTSSSVFTTGSYGWVLDDWMNVAGTNKAAKINLYSNVRRDWLISPTIDLAVGNDITLEFDLAVLTFAATTAGQLGADDSLAVVISTDNGTTWDIANTLQLWTAANTPLAGGMQHVSIPLNAYSGQVKIAFYGSEGIVDNTNDMDVMIDNFYVSWPLSINLENVKATNAGDRNRIDWNTASEDEGDGFVVERSFDGQNFTALGTVPAKGAASTYSFWDESPRTGANHYRLKLTSLEGTASYSKVVTATVAGRTAFSVKAYPNPVTDQLTIVITGGQDGKGTIIVTDISGKVMKQLDATNGQVTVDMKGLANGIYIVKYHDGTNAQTIKISKQ